LSFLVYFLAIVGGFIGLVWGADKFVDGSSAVARNWGVSPLIVGLTIVAFGTSAPEMLVSILAAMEHESGISIGNAIGSNITNVALILGISALICPLEVNSKIVQRELPLLLLIMGVVALLMMDGNLSRLDGGILLVGLFMLIGWMLYQAKSQRDGREDEDPLSSEFEQEMPVSMSSFKALMWILIGLIFLLLGARGVVWGASSVAKYFGISDLLIGLTIVAVGTSLPELAASVVSAMKKEHDIAVGNVVGSNMFNLLGVMCFPGLIAPGKFDPYVLHRDIPVMFGVTLMLWVFARGFLIKHKITRANGVVLLLSYVGYLVLLYVNHGHRP
jgi:cation:H+ antiporter